MDSKRIDISVIILYHNDASTIRRALESLVIQTPKSVEYILVDDCSTDDTTAIVEEFISQYPDLRSRFKRIRNPQNLGCAGAAVVGLSAAEGEYVIRCDADDYMEPCALQLMLDATDGGYYDVVMAPYYETYLDYRKEVQFKSKPSGLNDMPIDTLNFSVWSKLLRRKMLVDNGISQYEGLDCWEDLSVVSRVMALHPKVNFVDCPIYNYVRNRNKKTLSLSSKSRLLEDHLAICERIENWFVDKGLDEEHKEFLDYLKFCAKVKMLRGRGKKVARWKTTYPEVNNRIMSFRHVSLPLRVLFAAVVALPTVVSQAIADCCDVFYILED